MSNWKEPISLIRKRLRDWLVYSPVGNNVDSLDLDLLNRAQMWLSQYRQWDMLTKTVNIAVDENKTAVLPDDLNALLEVYVMLGNIGKPTLWYTANSPDIASRYTIDYTFDKATGRTATISFPFNAIIQGPLYIKYTYNLPDFVGTDEEGNELTEYSFFPPNLLLVCAKKIFSEDKGVTGDSQQLILNSFNEELRKFEMNSQYNNQAMDLTVKNKYGFPIKINGHALDGQGSGGAHSPYVPSTMFHGY